MLDTMSLSVANKAQRIFSLGEVLWDVFPDGSQFGGAPANFACNAAAHGAAVSMVSRVGRDVLGEQAIVALDSRGVCVDEIQRDAVLNTGTVSVRLNDRGVPAYTICEDVTWDHLEWLPAMREMADRVDAVYFGTLSQRSECAHQTIQQFVSRVPSTALRVYDINLRAPYNDERIIQASLQRANILKLSDEELDFVTEMAGIQGDTMTRLRALREQYQLRLIALTRGSQGAILMTENEVSDFGGVACDVIDTVGAGDSYTATLVTGILRGEPLAAINERACRVAAYVCSKKGATPPLPAHLAWEKMVGRDGFEPS